MNIFSHRFLLVATGVLGLALGAHAEPALLGHAGLKGQTMDADGVKAVLLGKKIMLGDIRAVVVIAKAGETQEQFLKSALGMTGSQFQNHWRRLFMTGGGTAPKIVETEADARKLVAETVGAIGIADSVEAEGLVILSDGK